MVTRLTKSNPEAGEIALSRVARRGRATPPEAGALLGKCAATIIRWANTNKIQSVRIGTHIYITVEELTAHGVKFPPGEAMTKLKGLQTFDSNDGDDNDYYD